MVYNQYPEDFPEFSPASQDMIDAARTIRDIWQQSNNHQDSFNQCACKYSLFLLKCFIDDLYKDTPSFPEHEKLWDQKRLMEILAHEHRP